MGDGGRVADRKRLNLKSRMKAAGGGKMVPAKDFNQEKILVNRDNNLMSSSTYKERGSAEVKQSYADKVKAERKKQHKQE